MARIFVGVEELTVQGYREEVNRLLLREPHKSEMDRLRGSYPKLRPIQVLIAYLLSYGEPLEHVCRCYSMTPFLFEQWKTLPEFNGILAELAPQHTGSIEGFHFDTVEQQVIFAEEMIKRLWMTIEERGLQYDADQDIETQRSGARHGMLSKKMRMSNGKVVGTEYTGDEATSRELRNWMNYLAKLRGLLAEAGSEEDSGISTITFKDLTVEEPEDGVKQTA